MGKVPACGRGRKVVKVGTIWAAAGVLVAVIALFVTWVQPSANEYDARARSCAGDLREVQVSVADLASIPARLNDDPNNKASLVAEANKFASADEAVHSDCPVGPKLEYIDFLDSKTYRHQSGIVQGCTGLALARSPEHCAPDKFEIAERAVIQCANAMIPKANGVENWSTWKK